MPSPPSKRPSVRPGIWPAGDGEVTADLHDQLVAGRSDEVGLVHAVGVGLDPLDRGPRVRRERGLGRIVGVGVGQQVLIRALALRLSTVLATMLTAVNAAFAAVSFTRRVRPAWRLRRPPSSSAWTASRHRPSRGGWVDLDEVDGATRGCAHAVSGLARG